MTTPVELMGEMWRVSMEDAQQQWQKFMSRAAGLPRIMSLAQKVRVGVTPSRCVYREDKLRLLQYETEPRLATPTLFVFALVNRPYILDLKEGKSVIRHFIDAGFPTYNIDWGIPSDGDRHLSLEDYVLRYMDHAIDEILKRTGRDRINIVGYCMGGSLSVMYTALKPEKVRNLILMAAPVDWSEKEHLLARWTDPAYFNVDQFIEVHGNAPPEWLQTSFAMLRPVNNLVAKYITLYENLDNEKFLEDFLAMETWLNDNIPVAGETFRQFVKQCMQRNELIRGKLEIGGERVAVEKISCPILNLTATADHLVPCGQSLPLKGAVASKDYEAVEFPAGHIGLAVSTKAHKDLWPKAAQWLAKRSEAL